MTNPAIELNEDVIVTHKVDRVNLFDFGYERAGNVNGDPDVYATYLDRIMNGDLVEESYRGLSDDEKKERSKDLKMLEKELKEAKQANAEIEEEVKEKEKTIENHRNDLLNIREARANDSEKLKEESFSVFKFSINLVILAALSVYLFFFYVSAAFKALYVDFEGIAESIAAGSGTGSIMPNAAELAEAIQYNFMLILVPFVFYAFGWAFHVLLEMKGNRKFVFLFGLICVTFAVDFLLAMIIHTNTETAKELMGLNTIPWMVSPTFYIILFLGFLVYIIWSILLDSLLREWDKKHVTGNIKKIIAHLREDIVLMQAELIDTVAIQMKISDYREDLATTFSGNLTKYIDQFSSGWISYLSPASMKDVKEKCLMVKKNFEEKYEVRPGQVKVVAKRA
ncbi:MAG: hypothetical protein RIG68_11145 [Imperialibacter sp.]|uniref:hypothetical protein n=1 Tax=Imperialibacter sp. TaxID=2038411 RepID=UPI0032EB70F8